MHKFYVEGADIKTGADREIVLEALTEADALKEARAMGILASSLKRMEEPEEPHESGDRHFSGNSGVVSAPVSATATAAAMTPDYLFLGFVAAIITAVGIVGVIVGGLMVVQGIVVHSEAAEEGVHNFVMGLVVIAGGLVQAGLGEGLKAFRDMARNSFRS